MHKCLIEICKEFENTQGFLAQKTEEKTKIVNELFYKFMECFAGLKEEKLNYPSEFINDVRLYNEGYEPLIKKFDDIEIRYLMLSDFYDFSRITKQYKKQN